MKDTFTNKNKYILSALIVVKFIIAVGVVLGVSIIAEHASPKWAGLAAGLSSQLIFVYCYYLISRRYSVVVSAL